MTKQQHLVEEMLYKYISYVNVLKLLDEVKCDLEKLVVHPAELVHRQEIALIFGEVLPM